MFSASGGGFTCNYGCILITLHLKAKVLSEHSLLHFGLIEKTFKETHFSTDFNCKTYTYIRRTRNTRKKKHPALKEDCSVSSGLSAALFRGWLAHRLTSLRLCVGSHVQYIITQWGPIISWHMSEKATERRRCPQEWESGGWRGKTIGKKKIKSQRSSSSGHFLDPSLKVLIPLLDVGLFSQRPLPRPNAVLSRIAVLAY